METKEEQKTKKQRKELKAKKSSLIYYLAGELLSEEFIAKQSRLFLLVIALIIFNISNRYSCLQKISEIESLKTQLQDLRYESLSVSSELTQHIKRSQVEELVLQNNLDIKTSNIPAVEIK